MLAAAAPEDVRFCDKPVAGPRLFACAGGRALFASAGLRVLLLPAEPAGRFAEEVPESPALAGRPIASLKRACCAGLVLAPEYADWPFQLGLLLVAPTVLRVAPLRFWL